MEATRALGSGARCVASSSAAASLPVAEVTHTVSNEVATSRSLPARYPPRNASTTAAAIAKRLQDRKSTRLNSSHGYISYAVFCLKKKKKRDVRRRERCQHCRG